MKRIFSYTIVVIVSSVVLTSAVLSINTCLKTNSNFYLISKLVEVVRDENANPRQKQVIAADDEKLHVADTILTSKVTSHLNPADNTYSITPTCYSSSSGTLAPDTLNSVSFLEEAPTSRLVSASSYLTYHISAQ